jgi:hypothetical protein
VSIIAMLAPPALRARMTGRSLWSLRYTDGRIVTEGEVDWSLAPMRGRQALRLYTPAGQIAALGNTEDATGRLFQLKGATATAGRRSRTDFHLIGIITGLNGECRCYAWEYSSGRLVGSFADNVFAMRYANIGRLSADVLGITPD